ncbi:MAG: methyltransferase domain-containing protein [bacterium]|nr:methyltransferase domain-containing protein [bacterium]
MAPTDSRRRGVFDALAEGWDDATSHDPVKLERIADFLSLKPGQQVLDAGCGTGVMIPFLRRRLGGSGAITALDFSLRMIAVAKGKYPPADNPDIKFVVQDVIGMASDREFDAIICYSCFPHFPDQAAVVRTLAAALKEGGRLVIAHSQSRRAINDLHRVAGELMRGDYLPTVPEITGMMESAGLRVTGSVDDEELFVVRAERPSA